MIWITINAQHLSHFLTSSGKSFVSSLCFCFSARLAVQIASQCVLQLSCMVSIYAYGFCACVSFGWPSSLFGVCVPVCSTTKTTSDLSELLRQLNVYSMRLRTLTVDSTHSNATLLCNASVSNALRDINVKRQSLHEGLRSGLVLKRTWIEFVSGSIVVFSFKSLICAHLRST